MGGSYCESRGRLITEFEYAANFCGILVALAIEAVLRTFTVYYQREDGSNGIGWPVTVDNQCHALALHFVHYNFCRVYKPLRVSLAMQAGPIT